MADVPDIDEMPDPATPAESFWKLNAAQTVTVGVVVLGGLWQVFATQRDTAENSKANERTVALIEKQGERINSLEEYIKSIDRNGTQYGKGTYNVRTQEAEQTIKRVEKLEESMNKLVPSVERMSTNLEWISGWVKVQAQQPTDHK